MTGRVQAPQLLWVGDVVRTPEGWTYTVQREHALHEGVWYESWFRGDVETFTIHGSGSYGKGAKARAKAAALAHYRARIAPASSLDPSSRG